MISKILVLSLLFAGLSADDFTCPKDKITMADGKTGVIPKGATSMMKFAANTQCTYTFTIPEGYAINMELSANYDASPGDYVQFDYFYITSGSVKQVQYAVGPELNVTFLSITGNLTFFAQYSYVDLNGYSQVIKKTGDYFNSTLMPQTYYTVQAADGDTVTWNLAMRNTGFYDQSIFELMMFDGPDIINSAYIGRITEYSRSFGFHSETNTLTFLNLYGSPSDTYIMVNDYSKIKPISQYNTWLVDPTKETTGFMYNALREDDSYFTFICDGCTQFYIEDLSFRNESAPDGYIEVQGMSPTQGLPAVLNYTNSPFTNMSLPQLIPTRMATFHAHKAYVEFFFKTELQSGYFAVGNDKKRSVYSPKLWNPDADQKFDYTFSDTEKVYNFSINLESVKLMEDGDELDVQVGSVNGLTTLDKKYTKTAVSNVPLSGMGRYLHLKYTGSKNSEVIINFEEIDPTATTSPGQTTGTTVAPGRSETTPVPTPRSVPTSSVGSSMSSTAPTSPRVSTSTAQSTSSPTTAPIATGSTPPPTSSTAQPSPTTQKVINTSSSTQETSTTTVSTSTLFSTTQETTTTKRTPPPTTTLRHSSTSTIVSSTLSTIIDRNTITSTPTNAVTTFSTQSTTSTASVPISTTTMSLPSASTMTISTVSPISNTKPTISSPPSTPTPSTNPPTQAISTTVRTSRLPSTYSPSPATQGARDAASVSMSTSTVHTTTSGASPITGFFSLVTLLSCITFL